MQISGVSEIFVNEERKMFGFTISYLDGSFINITESFEKGDRQKIYEEITNKRENIMKKWKNEQPQEQGIKKGEDDEKKS